MGGRHLMIFGSPNYYNMIQMHLYMSKCFDYNDNQLQNRPYMDIIIRTIDFRNDNQKIFN